MGEAARRIEQDVWSLDAFLAMDFGEQYGDLKVELIDGHIVVAQAAPSRSHARLVAEIGRHIGNAIERRQVPCITESGSDVRIDGRLSGLGRDYALIPDLQVRCGGGPTDEGEPSLVIEVLSPSNGATEMMLKLRAYMAVPSIVDILLVHQSQPIVHHHRRAPDGGWAAISLAGPDAVLTIERLGLDVRLDSLYRTALPPQAGSPEAE